MAFSVMTFSIQDMLNIALYVFFGLNVVMLGVVAPFPLPPSPSLSILAYGNVSLSVGY